MMGMWFCWMRRKRRSLTLIHEGESKSWFGLLRSMTCKLCTIPLPSCKTGETSGGSLLLHSPVSSTAYVRELCKKGQLMEALCSLHSMEQTGIKADAQTLSSFFHTCIDMKALKEGKHIHEYIKRIGLDSDTFIGNNLITMYVKCGNVGDAYRVFSTMVKRNVISWNVIISGLAHHGHGGEALKLFWQMQILGMKPNKITFISVLNACHSQDAMAEGKLIHGYIVWSRMESDVVVGTALVNMYSNCARIDSAYRFFCRMAKEDVVSWNAMLSGFVQHGDGEAALKLFRQIQQEGVKCNNVTILNVLSACTCLGALADGKVVHAFTVDSGVEADVIIGTALLNMYNKCGSMRDASHVFEKMPRRDVVSWNAMITGCAENECIGDAFVLFQQMIKEGLEPNEISFISILNACANLKALAEGRLIHAFIVDSRRELDCAIGNALVDMYGKCSMIEDAYRVFEKATNRNVVSWTAIIAAYAQQGSNEEALKLFWQMQKSNLEPNEITLISALNACANPAGHAEGKLIHAHIVSSGMNLDNVIGSALVNMYNKCASIQDACCVFHKLSKPDVVLYTVMIEGYSQNGYDKEALEVFTEMQEEGIKPDQLAFCSVLKSCSNLSALSEGKQVHASITEIGLESDGAVANALVDMYINCGSIDDASHVFNRMHREDVLLWNAMIARCNQRGYSNKAIQFYKQMQSERIKPDQFTFSSILSACGSLADLMQGKQVHADTIEAGFESDVFVGNALIDMYAKCGKMEVAYQVFYKMPKRDVISWNTIITGCSLYGNGEETLELFEQMQCEGVEPDEITFSSMFSACSHAGLIDKGFYYFDLMNHEYGAPPTAEHYAGMVDLLGRAGCLGEAETLIHKMPFYPNVVVWVSLLGACRNHGNVELAEKAVDHILQLEPDNIAVFVLLANIYAASSRWDHQARLRKEMLDRGIGKEPSFSCI